MDMDDLPGTIPQMMANSFATRGPVEAIVSPDGNLTYDAFDAEIVRLSRALVASGAGKGTRIAIMAPDGAKWFTMFMAITGIGAVVIPISTFCSPPELGHILRHSDAHVLIASRHFLRHDFGERLENALPGLSSAGGAPLHLKAAPYLRSIWLDDASGLGWAGSEADLLARADGPDAPDAALIGEIQREVVPSDDALVIYTSGSTALPKGVVHVHRTVAQHSAVMADIFLLDSDARLMPLLPAFWVGGLQIALEVLLKGGTLVYPRDRKNDTVIETLERHKVNRINVWGPQHAQLREAAIARGIDVDAIFGLGEWRDSKGELIPPGRAPNLLGMSESWGPHSGEPLDFLLPEDRAGASGRALGGVERRVVDPETGEELPPGEVGELQLRGGAVMKGFYKADPRDVFTRDGFFPTNDLVSIDADGYLYFKARQGDMLKTSGANVSRLEVEAALRSLPEVDLPIVVGLPHDELGQLVAAAVVPRAGQAPTEEGLKAALKEKLSTYKVPRRIIFLKPEDVEWTPSNKIKLTEMKALIADRVAEEVPAG